MSEYHKACGHHVPEEVALSVLIRCLPAHIRQHVQLNLEDTSTYSTVRTKVLGFESVTNSWSSQRIHTEFGIAGTQPNNGPQPMEVDMVQYKGKGKPGGKSKSDKGKGKQGTKGKFDKGKSKADKGKGKQPDAESNVCLYCKKAGHWKRDCRKFLRDKQNGTVRQVEQHDSSSQPPSSPSASITSSPHTTYVGQSSPTASPKTSSSSQVRRVAFEPLWEDSSSVFVDELPGLEIFDGQISAIVATCFPCGSECFAASEVQCFDMTYTDHDEDLDVCMGQL